MHEAMFFSKESDSVICSLCPHNCRITLGKHGVCGVRMNDGGKLVTLAYGKAIATHIDPVEKKPLYHFYPGSRIFSFATSGCNLKCDFCQNWEISQMSKGAGGSIAGEDLSPKEIVKSAILGGCRSLAMTYSEPTIFFEYAYDTCIEAKNKGLSTVFVSNGFINKEPVKKISKVLDAINIDIKSFSEQFYRNICGGKLAPILESVKLYHDEGVWVEITTLVVPGQNDSDEELSRIAQFIASVDKDIPWHISRFHADYKRLDTEDTPIDTLERAYEIGKKAGLKYVYVGNVLNYHEDTLCPACGKILIKRQGYNISFNEINDSKCACGQKISGRF